MPSRASPADGRSASASQGCVGGALALAACRCAWTTTVPTIHTVAGNDTNPPSDTVQGWTVSHGLTPVAGIDTNYTLSTTPAR
jgi:hypothetical protein